MTDPVLYRPVGEAAVLVQFAEDISDAAYSKVLALDASLASQPLPGMIEAVPAYVSLLIRFDPIVTRLDAVVAEVSRRLDGGLTTSSLSREVVIPVCYETGHAPDRADVARQLGVAEDEVARLHSSGNYRVYMYGFAPGYAYMGGVPGALRLPRKSDAVRGHPVGSIVIAGEQCLVTTLPMPTGWWVIGRTPVRVFDSGSTSSFLFQPGDRVRFEPISSARFADLADI